MRRPLTALALVLAASPLWAGEARMSAMMFDKNSPVSDRGSAGDFSETAARQNGLDEEAPPPPPPADTLKPEAAGDPPREEPAAEPSPVTPRGHAREASSAQPQTQQPAPERIGAFIPRDPAAQRYYGGPAREKLSDAVADTPRASESGKAYRLWNTVSAPLSMTAAQVTRAAGADEADAAAGAEYERRILGAAASNGGPGLASAGSVPDMPAGFGAAAGAAASTAQAKAAPGQVFVSVDIAATEKAGLKDAVAGLTSVTGFRPDPRFPPQASDFASPGAAARAATSLRGWMPVDKLGAAVTAAGVLRVQVDHSGPRPEGASAAVTRLVVGLRIPAQASAGETFQRTISELASSARFRWTRTVGFQAIPNSKDVALVVVGEVPVTRIPRLLENPDVLKVAPAPLEPQAAEPPRRPRSRLADFADYVRRKAPLLVALTLLLLLPSVGGVVMKVGQAFVPYER